MPTHSLATDLHKLDGIFHRACPDKLYQPLLFDSVPDVPRGGKATARERERGKTRECVRRWTREDKAE